MACNTINMGINAKCDTSMGGIVEVYIANADEYKYSQEDDGTLSVDRVKEGAKWYKFAFRKGTS